MPFVSFMVLFMAPSRCLWCLLWPRLAVYGAFYGRMSPSMVHLMGPCRHLWCISWARVAVYGAAMVPFMAPSRRLWCILWPRLAVYGAFYAPVSPFTVPFIAPSRRLWCLVWPRVAVFGALYGSVSLLLPLAICSCPHSRFARAPIHPSRMRPVPSSCRPCLAPSQKILIF